MDDAFHLPPATKQGLFKWNPGMGVDISFSFCDNHFLIHLPLTRGTNLSSSVTRRCKKVRLKFLLLWCAWFGSESSGGTEIPN